MREFGKQRLTDARRATVCLALTFAIATGTNATPVSEVWHCWKRSAVGSPAATLMAVHDSEDEFHRGIGSMDLHDLPPMETSFSVQGLTRHWSTRRGNTGQSFVIGPHGGIEGGGAYHSSPNVAHNIYQER